MPKTRSTTQTGPAKSPAEVKQQPITPTRSDALPKSIDLITDAVSEMLTTGTTDRSLDRLLSASLEHIARRTYERGIGVDDQKVVREGIDIENRRHFQEWKEDIFAVWRNHRRESPAAIAPATVAERIRANARESLEDQLDRFLGAATPEEIRFLLEVLRGRDAVAYVSPTSNLSDMPLGQAFEFELGRSDVYMVVPERLQEQVQKYVDALRAIEDKEVA